MYRLVIWIFPILAAAQSSVTTAVQRDLNGNRVEVSAAVESKEGASSTTSEMHRTVNGTVAPRLKIEERVLRDDASGRLIERIVRKYDQTGQPGPLEKEVVEEQKGAGGSTTAKRTVYRADLNGTLVAAERSVTESRIEGSRQSTQTVLEKPALDGSFEAVEKKTAVRVTEAGGYQETSSTFRKGTQGFYEAARETTTETTAGNQSTAQTTRYEIGSSGTLEARAQEVKRVTKLAGGGQLSETDVYGASPAGTVGSSGGALRLQTRETVEKRREPGGSVEVVKLRQPTVSDPGKLGAAVVVNETVCRGKCP